MPTTVVPLDPEVSYSALSEAVVGRGRKIISSIIAIKLVHIKF